jgi:ABC-2 type transport system permease protein/oleandomycin transport system permease protein
MGMIVFPLAFISSAYIPIATMPGWLQVFARHQPLTPMVDSVRALTLGQAASTALTQALLWTAAIVFVFVPLAVAKYRRG